MAHVLCSMSAGMRWNGIAEGACDCDGNTIDACGECGGDGITEGTVTVRVHCLRRATIVLATA